MELPQGDTDLEPFVKPLPQSLMSAGAAVCSGRHVPGAHRQPRRARAQALQQGLPDSPLRGPPLPAVPQRQVPVGCAGPKSYSALYHFQTGKVFTHHSLYQIKSQSAMIMT